MRIDIVERLREHRMTTDWQVAVSEAHEAADEIERLRGELADAETDAAHDRQQIRENAASITALQAENAKLRTALEPFAEMGRVMMGRRHHMEAVIQYALARTVKVHHLIAAHEARSALGGEE